MQKFSAYICLIATLALAATSAVAATHMPFGMWKASSYAPSSYIRSIQNGSITIASGSTSNTATISSVTTANTWLKYDGVTATSTSNVQSVATRITLTNSTTVTATRGASNSDAVTVYFSVVEFSSGVNSIQYGTVAVSAAQTSNTATISSVGATSFVGWLGSSSATSQTSYSRVATSVDLTNSTTVTGHIGLTTSAMTIGFVVVDLSSDIVSSVQQKTTTDTSNTTSWTDSITAVVPEHTLIQYNGSTISTGTGCNQTCQNVLLTSSTQVTISIAAGSATSKSIYYTVIEFSAGALNGSVQRASRTIGSGASSDVYTISNVDTGKSIVNMAGFRGNGNLNTTQTAASLSSFYQVTTQVNSVSSGFPTASWEVLRFN